MFSKRFNPKEIDGLIHRSVPSRTELEEVLCASNEGLTLAQAAVLITAFADPTLRAMVRQEAVAVRKGDHDNTLAVITPLYIANGSLLYNGCMDYCGTCGFRNGQLRPEEICQLTPEQTHAEARHIVRLGSRTIQLVAATIPEFFKPENVVPHISAAKTAGAKRIGLNVFPLPKPEHYVLLREAGCGFVVLFQETYDEPTYKAEYHHGPKNDMKRRLNAHDLACKAEITTVGLGVLGGLYDWRFDTLAAIDHALYLQETYGAQIIFGQYRIKEARGAESAVTLKPMTDEELVHMGFVYTLSVRGSRPWLYANETKPLAARCMEGGGCAVTVTCSPAVGGYARQSTGPVQFQNASEPFAEGVEWWARSGFNVQTASL